MLTVYSWPTHNGQKVHIMLEECGFCLGNDWQAVPVNIGTCEQFKPEFLAISPNNKIPALLDPAGPDGKPIALLESGAILLYLAAKTGKFLPKTDRLKFQVLQWLMFQMSGVGPMMARRTTFANMRRKRSTTRSIATPTKPTAVWRHGQAACGQQIHLPATITALPTWLFFRGCATGKTTALTGPIIRTFKPGVRSGGCTPGRAARRPGAGRPAPAHHRCHSTRGAGWQNAVPEALTFFMQGRVRPAFPRPGSQSALTELPSGLTSLAVARGQLHPGSRTTRQWRNHWYRSAGS